MPGLQSCSWLLITLLSIMDQQVFLFPLVLSLQQQPLSGSAKD